MSRIHRVLVVDDDQVTLRIFGCTFARLGLEAYTATTSAEARELARLHQPDLCITDLMLVGESGLALLPELRALLPTAKLVLMSGYGSIDVAVRAVKAGADEVVEKPITAREILARVQGEAVGVEAGAAVELETPSLDRALWEHVSRVVADCAGNKSEAARRLRKPRSWLQRFLLRSAPRAGAA